ncbi:MAG: hypothetical protein IH859_08055, partial [Chloroflexi bacterium]|nr:hypothetical protein [Chloroflexota bacterium]
GAIPELVNPDDVRIVPYGGNPWNLDPPDITALAAAAVDIIERQARFRSAARHHAKEQFGLANMVTQYLDVLLPN